MRKAEKSEEQFFITQSLKQIDDKLVDSEDRHSLRLNRVMSEARLKNNILGEKMTKWKEHVEK